MKPVIIAAIALLVLLAGCTTGGVKVQEWKGADGRWYRGSPDATVTILEYSDFQCPYCGKVQPTVEQVLSTYGNRIKLSFRHFPLEQIHPYALEAAYASECAADQGKFWAMHDKLFANQNALTEADLLAYAKDIGLDQGAFSACLKSGTKQSVVDADIAAGDAAGVHGTPSFMVGSKLVVGAVPYEQFASAIDAQLK